MSGDSVLAVSDEFATELLRGHDDRASRVAETDDARSALVEKRALDGMGLSPPEPPQGELARYLRARALTLAFDDAGLAGLAQQASDRVGALALGWAAVLRGEPGAPPPREGGSDALSRALDVEALLLAAALSERGEQPSLARELGLLREAAALASQADQPHAQYLAYAALARSRRRMDRVPMATRLLASLVRGAPATYHAWLAWEARLLGLERPSAAVTLAFDGLLEAARVGDRAAFTEAAQQLGRVAPSATILGEAHALVSALDPHAELASLDAPTRAFVCGERADLWSGLEGVIADPSDDATAIALVIVGPAGARRVLAPGVGLAGPMPRLAVSEHGGRTETAIATLGACPDGMGDEDFFRAVYGFAFKKALHDGVLRVLLTRMRQALEPHASLTRSPRLRLVVHTPFVVVDPRVASRADNAVLRALASERAVSAKTLAERTGLPLRTVQAELARLLDEGVCKKAKDGRSTEYLVEDTVVREPSRVIAARAP